MNIMKPFLFLSILLATSCSNDMCVCPTPQEPAMIQIVVYRSPSSNRCTAGEYKIFVDGMMGTYLFPGEVDTLKVRDGAELRATQNSTCNANLTVVDTVASDSLRWKVGS